MVALVVAIAGGAALFIAVGFVIQQHVAAQEPPEFRLSFRLLFELAQRPLWLGGIVTMAVGQLLGAFALSKGTLALVEPLLAANLLFALPLSARWHHRRLGRQEWVGALSLIGGLAAFIAAGDPRGGNARQLPWPNWVAAIVGIAAVVSLLVTFSKRREPARQATMLASAAGVMYGLQDAITQRLVTGIGHGPFFGILTWSTLFLLSVAIVGMLFGQSAFESAPLDASLPAITIAEPTTAIVLGLSVYGQRLRLAPPQLAVELVGFAAMVIGVYLVATSPVVTGRARHPNPVGAGEKPR